jgi:transposase
MPEGALDARVQTVGPTHFGIVSVDCAKSCSTWALRNFYGDILRPLATVNHTAPGFRQMLDALRAAIARYDLRHVLVAVERTGNYHRPVQRAFRDAGFETRLVHPFASQKFRQIENPDNKTDDNDLFGIHRAAAIGFGFLEVPLPETYRTLQALARHRRDLVQKVSAVQQQMREHLHAILPGFAALFQGDTLWTSPVALPLARRLAVPEAVCRLGSQGITQLLREAGLRCQQRTIDKIVGWAAQAAPPAEEALVRHRILCDLDDDRIAKRRLISRVEFDCAGCLACTPYVLLMAIPGINVVSAAELAGEAGPIEHYANPNALTGRAGLFPSRYQSDSVDLSGHLVRSANRRLRAALMRVADSLLTVNHFFRAQGALWKTQRVAPGLQRVRVAKRFSRLAFVMLAGRLIVPHACCRDPHYVLDKLVGFHLEHPEAGGSARLREDLAAAADQLPRQARSREAQALGSSAARFEKSRSSHVRSLGSLLKEVLADKLLRKVQSSAEV